jgi:hypothetical protein
MPLIYSFLVKPVLVLLLTVILSAGFSLCGGPASTQTQLTSPQVIGTLSAKSGQSSWYACTYGGAPKVGQKTALTFCSRNPPWTSAAFKQTLAGISIYLKDANGNEATIDMAANNDVKTPAGMDGQYLQKYKGISDYDAAIDSPSQSLYIFKKV